MNGKVFKVLLLSFAVCLGTAIIVGLFGRVEGEEFCPQRFTVRRFRYYQIPFLHLQVAPVTFSPSSRGNGPLSTYLRTKKMLSSSGSKVRWDIVYLGEVSLDSSRGDAEILIQYLEQPGAIGTKSWLDWTKDPEHEEVGRFLWPLISKMAEDHLYILMPDVFDWARAATDRDAFVARVRSKLPARIQRLADAERLRKNNDRASQLEGVVNFIDKLEEAVPGRSIDAIDAEVEPKESDID